MGWDEKVYAGDIRFTIECLDQFHIQAQVFEYPYTKILDSKISYQNMLLDHKALLQFFKNAVDQFQENVIYRLYDSLLCNYIALKLPDTNPQAVFIIGPFLLERVTSDQVLNTISALNLPTSIKDDLCSYYDVLPLIDSDEHIFTILRILGKHIWGSFENYSIERRNDLYQILREAEPSFNYEVDPTTPSIKIALIKQRYDLENELLNAVSKGHIHQAEMILNRFIAITKTEERNHDPLRNMKNYLIIFNTLFRKAAERGYVHPLQLDRLSSQIAIKIESLNNVTAAKNFSHEMVRKYTMLVRNQSLREYSDIIRQTLTYISSDITADLTLKTIAGELNINASYLSSLFKKEMHVTLTEYVTKKRIEQAIFLLNSTPLPIAEIAQFCGIPDLQYFSKIFKRQIGKTPSEYRKMLKENT